MLIIIDGYNVLRLAEKFEGWEKITDVQLCFMISQYLRITADPGEIIFDGIGPPDKSPFERISNLEIIFSGRSSDADSIILNKISINSAPKNLMVVSSDRELQTAARRRRAIPMKSQTFFAHIVEQMSKPPRGPSEPPAKRHGLTEGETDEWLKTFGLD